jgi:hypothetical protein
MAASGTKAELDCPMSSYMKRCKISAVPSPAKRYRAGGVVASTRPLSGSVASDVSAATPRDPSAPTPFKLAAPTTDAKPGCPEHDAVRSMLSPAFTDLSGDLSMGSLGGSPLDSGADDREDGGFSDLSPAPHPMQAAEGRPSPPFGRGHPHASPSDSVSSDGTTFFSPPAGIPLPDQSAFVSSALVGKSAVRRGSREGPLCPDTPLRKTPTREDDGLKDSQVLFDAASLSAGRIDFTSPPRNTAAAAAQAPASGEASSSSSSPPESRFEYGEMIGCGAFGDVFKARCRATGEQFAIKKTKQQFRSEHERDHCLQEVRNVMEIGEHPNIVRYFGAWLSGGYLYVQMELCSLGTLKAYAMQLEDLTEEELWTTVADVASGLSHIHGKGKIHLDLKPDNIFLTSEGTLQIGDFGVTVDLGGAGMAFEDGNEGDSVYLAAEVLDQQIGPAADIFSLGLTAFELAARVELPANGEMWRELRRHPDAVVVIPGDAQLERLARQMMAWEPAHRPTAAVSSSSSAPAPPLPPPCCLAPAPALARQACRLCVPHQLTVPARAYLPPGLLPPQDLLQHEHVDRVRRLPQEQRPCFTRKLRWADGSPRCSSPRCRLGQLGRTESLALELAEAEHLGDLPSSLDMALGLLPPGADGGAPPAETDEEVEMEPFTPTTHTSPFSLPIV